MNKIEIINVDAEHEVYLLSGAYLDRDRVSSYVERTSERAHRHLNEVRLVLDL